MVKENITVNGQNWLIANPYTECHKEIEKLQKLFIWS